MKRLALSLAVALTLPVSVQASDSQRIARLEQQVNMLIQRVSQLQQNQTVIAEKIGLIDDNKITPDESVPLKGSILTGEQNAPIAIMEFTDVQCPFCQSFTLESYPKLKEEFIETGKVIFAHRQNPLNKHAQAKDAAARIICANQQGAFEQVKHALFTEDELVKQEKWQEITALADLDQEELATCLADDRIYKQIELDKELAKAMGITKTPTFVIGINNNGTLENWKKLEGAPKYDDLSEIIDTLIENN